MLPTWFCVKAKVLRGLLKKYVVVAFCYKDRKVELVCTLDNGIIRNVFVEASQLQFFKKNIGNEICTFLLINSVCQ